MLDDAFVVADLALATFGLLILLCSLGILIYEAKGWIDYWRRR